jgi:uncharacterized protein
VNYPINSVHAFDFKDKHYLFDGNSMLIAEVSKVLGEAVQLCAQREEYEVHSLLKERFGWEKATSLLESIDALNECGFFKSLSSAALQSQCAASKESSWANPVFVTMEMILTGRCNLRCTYCYADHGSFQGTVKLPYMPISTASAALDLFLNRTREAAFIVLLGGEPLLHPSFIELLELVREKSEKARVKTRVSMTTNGTICTEELLRAFADHNVQVSVSIDGPQTVHDKQRPFANGSGSYEVVMGNCEKMLHHLGPENVSLRVTCTNQNIPGLLGFFREIRKRLGSLKVDFSPVIVRESNSCSLFRVCQTEYSELRRKVIDDEIARYDSLVRLSRDQARRIMQMNAMFAKRKYISKCEFGVNLITVTPEGDVYPCAGLVDRPEYKMGDTGGGLTGRGGKVWEVFDGNMVFKRPQCQTCWAKYICAGGCVAANVIVGSDPLESPESLCSIYKSSAEKTLLGFVAGNHQFWTISSVQGDKKGENA